MIGILGNAHMINETYEVHGAGSLNSRAIALVSECTPLIVPSDPELCDVGALMDACDGFLLTGGRPNVHPEEYGEPATEAHGAFDRARDRVAIELVRACLERGQPVLGICRGFQEVNVAMGGTLYPEIRDLPGRMNHRMPPDGTLEEKFELRHDVTFTPNGMFHHMMGAQVVRTNTLHGQGIKVAGARVIIDGFAEDETPEAIYIEGAKGYLCAVQWHPEWDAANDPVSRPLFQSFGTAAREWRAQGGKPVLKTA